MKASELIKKLEALIAQHGDRDVWTQGCDCSGESGNVIPTEEAQERDVGYDAPDDTFLIERA